VLIFDAASPHDLPEEGAYDLAGVAQGLPPPMLRAGTAPDRGNRSHTALLNPMACDMVSGAKRPSGSCRMRSSLILPAGAATTARAEFSDSGSTPSCAARSRSLS